MEDEKINNDTECDKLFESLYDIIRSDKEDMKPEEFLNVYNNVKSYIIKYNTVRNDKNYEHKFVYENGYTISDEYSPNKQRKKKFASKITKNEDGITKGYISAKKCALSKYKEIQYAFYKSYDLEDHNYKHFNKTCCTYWKNLKDDEKYKHLNNKIAIPIEIYK